MKKAFSLVEILVALVIVSVIMAALAPVITKKLSSAGITIVGGGSGGEQTWRAPTSQEDCDPFHAYYHNGLCITKKNIGDAPLSSGLTGVKYITAFDSSSKCPSVSTPCCWIGTTSGECPASTTQYSLQGYGGCNRTLCNWAGANVSCSKYAIEGTSGKWRLPTIDELVEMGLISDGDKLDFCNNTGASKAPQCNNTKDCAYTATGHASTWCHAHALWSGTPAAETHLFVAKADDSVGLPSSGYGPGYSFSVRCVLDQIPVSGSTGGSTPSTPVEPQFSTSCSSVDSNCLLCKDNKCVVCKNAYDLTVDGTCSAEAALDVNSLVNHPYTTSCSSFANCALCSASACVVCQNGYNLASGTCSAEAAVVHPISTSCTSIDANCTSCAEGKCLTCKDNYNVLNGICEAKYTIGEPRHQGDCDPFNAVFIPKKYNGTGTMAANFCVTKYNVAQGSGTEAPVFNPLVGRQNGRLVNSTETVTGYSGYSCVVGPTARYYTGVMDENTIEGGKYRTVCGKYAISNSCLAWKKDGSMWRALHKSIVDGWISNYSSSEELRTLINDLNFCTETSISGKTRCKDDGGSRCLGVYNDTCYPYLNFASNGEDVYMFQLTSTTISYKYTNPDESMLVSGRCMSNYVPLK